MKYIKYVLAILFSLIPLNAYASGGIAVSPTSLTIEVGSSKTFKITATNAIGDVLISSSNTGVAKVNTSEWSTGMVDENETKSETITVTGVSEGSAVITLDIDAATFDSEDLSGTKKTINVTVIPKKVDNTPKKSTNNNIKEINVDGYDLIKKDSKNYTLTVNNDVSSIKVNATLEDEKANISGVGTHELKVGLNTITLVITSESGSKNTITIEVTRKDGYYLEDLEKVLNDTNLNTINIDSNSILTSSDIEKIKNSKKVVNLNYYDEDGKLRYSIELNGAKINQTNDYNTHIEINNKVNDDIKKASNYAEGIWFKLSQNEIKDVKIKFAVDDKFKNGDIVKIYSYDASNSKMRSISDEVVVKDGFVEFSPNDGNDYLITMSNISSSCTNNAIGLSRNTIIIALVFVIVVLILEIVYFIKIKKTSTIKQM